MGRKAKRGRPKAADAKVHPLSIRTTLAMRRRLEAAADANGRSLAREIETRLDESLGRQSNAKLMEELGMAVSMIEETLGKSWRDDAETMETIIEFIGETFRQLHAQAATDPDRPESERMFKILMALSDDLAGLSAGARKRGRQ